MDDGDSDALKDLAVKVFGTLDSAEAWMNRSHPLLGGRTPMETASESEQGRIGVLELIVALRFGGPA